MNKGTFAGICWAGVAILSLAGLGVAAYLTIAYFSGASLACGNVGNCDYVTSSDYAKLLGIPISPLGFATYSALLLGSLAIVALEEPPALLRWGVLALAVVGVGFSIYLTIIELFVLHAICVYCVASAVLITAILGLLVVVWYLEQNPDADNDIEHPWRLRPRRLHREAYESLS